MAMQWCVLLIAYSWMTISVDTAAHLHNAVTIEKRTSGNCSEFETALHIIMRYD